MVKAGLLGMVVTEYFSKCVKKSGRCQSGSFFFDKEELTYPTIAIGIFTSKSNYGIYLYLELSITIFPALLLWREGLV